MQLMVLAGVFIGTVALLIGAFVFVNRRRLAASQAARTRLSTLDEDPDRPRLLRDDAVSSLPFLNRLLTGQSFTDELALQLQRAGSTNSPGGYIMIVIASGLAGVMLGSLVGALGTLIFALLGFAAPIVWLSRRQKRRLAAFEEQLPEAIDMIISAMRAGYSFQAAMKFIGEEVSEPLGPEFSRFYDEQRLGIEVREALLSSQERIGSLDYKMFVTAVLIQRETGGNLGEILTNLSTLMRERVTVRGQIETLTSEPKLSARILASLPVVVFLALQLIDPGFMKPMIESQVGLMALGAGAVSVVFGYLVMMKIADVDY